MAELDVKIEIAKEILIKIFISFFSNCGLDLGKRNALFQKLPFQTTIHNQFLFRK